MVSYSRKDSVAARKLINSFKELGLDVWVDWEDIPPAVGWLNQILRGIEEADAFIFLLSPDSIVSEICNEEINHAGKNNKRIIPIVVRDVDVKAVNPIIRELNWIFGREQDVYDECLTKIKLAIELDLAWVEEHRRLQVRALEWDRRKDVSLLLRGRDLRSARQMVISAASKDPTPTDLQHIYIHHSNRDERFRIATWIGVAFAVVVLIVVAGLTYNQLGLATRQATLEADNRILAEEKAAALSTAAAAEAQRADIAEENQRLAQQSKISAEGQRSAAIAQIYQSRPGGLYASTLLAIDSWQRTESAGGEEIARKDAEQILRKNISLLPVPVGQMTHAGRINSLEISPDGGMFVAASADRTACAWNVTDGAMVFCTDSPGQVNDAAFGLDLDGQIVALGDEQGHVKLLDAGTGAWRNEFLMVRNPDPTRILLTLSEDQAVSETEANSAVAVRDISFNLERKLLVITRDDGIIVKIDLTKKPGDRFFYSSISTSGSLQVSGFSPDGNWFAAGSKTGSVVIWDLNTTVLETIPHQKNEEVTSLEFSPDSSKIISGGTDGQAIVSLARVDKRRLFSIANEGRVEDIAFGPDGTWFVTVSSDGRIRVWDVDWNLNTYVERLRMLQSSRVTEVKVSCDGRWIATTGSDATARLWDAVTGSQILEIPLDSAGSVLAFSAGEAPCLDASPAENYLISGEEGGRIGIWNLSSVTPPAGQRSLSGFAGDVQFSPTADWLIASEENRLWKLDSADFSTPGELRPDKLIFKSTDNIKKFLISPDSRWIGILVNAGDLIVYDLRTNSALSPVALSDPDLTFVFAEDGSQLITAGKDGVVRAWDLASGESPQTLYRAEPGSSVLSLAISKTRMAIGLKDQIVLLDLASGKLLPGIKSNGDNHLIAFNTDASMLASANSSGQINVWKIAGERFEPLPPVSNAQVFSMAFGSSGDQPWLLAGAQDGLYVFDPMTGQEIARLPHKDIVRGVSFSPNGNRLATASDRLIQLWEPDALPIIREDELIKTACSRLVQNFSLVQWTTFFGDERPRHLCPELPVPDNAY